MIKYSLKEQYFPLLGMEIDIFEVINKELNKQKRKAPWLAGEIGTSSRNMHTILNDRKDIYLEVCFRISIALKRNLFKLYIPFIDAAISAAASKDSLSLEPHSKETTKINIGIKYPESQVSDIGDFLKHVKALAKEYGFEVE